MLLTEHLKQLRARAIKVGVARIAKQAGLDYNTVNNFVLGKNPTERSMVAVEKACDELEKNHVSE